jgi:hypothetical protein
MKIPTHKATKQQNFSENGDVVSKRQNSPKVLVLLFFKTHLIHTTTEVKT